MVARCRCQGTGRQLGPRSPPRTTRRRPPGATCSPRAATPWTPRSRSTRCSRSSIRTCAASGATCFLLYHEARTGEVHCLNGTGPAPRAATRAAFAERGLDAVPVRGALSVTVPGTVAAWEVAAERFGTRALGDLLGPAVDAAADGVEIGDRLAGWAADARDDLRTDPTLARRLLDAAGAPLPPRATLRQPELARPCAASPATARATSTPASSATRSRGRSARPAACWPPRTCAPTRPAGSRRSGSGTRAWTSSPRPPTARASRRC